MYRNVQPWEGFVKPTIKIMNIYEPAGRAREYSSREIAEYVGNQFLDLWNDYLL